jgi:hypothetical protein
MNNKVCIVIRKLNSILLCLLPFGIVLAIMAIIKASKKCNVNQENNNG